jgi:hypothetical protein
VNNDVKSKFESIPENIRLPLLSIRQAIFEIAEADKIGDIEETLKWGDPSYLAKGGSTVRINRLSKIVSKYRRLLSLPNNRN